MSAAAVSMLNSELLGHTRPLQQTQNDFSISAEHCREQREKDQQRHHLLRKVDTSMGRSREVYIWKEKKGFFRALVRGLDNGIFKMSIKKEDS